MLLYNFVWIWVLWLAGTFVQDIRLKSKGEEMHDKPISAERMAGLQRGY